MNSYTKLNTKHFELNHYGQLVTPDLNEFIAEFTEEGSFTTPEGTVEANDLLEHIDFSTRQIAHDAIQMEALKGAPLSEAEAAKNWFKLEALMNDAAADFYKSNIVPDYQDGDL